MRLSRSRWLTLFVLAKVGFAGAWIAAQRPDSREVVAPVTTARSEVREAPPSQAQPPAPPSLTLIAPAAPSDTPPQPAANSPPATPAAPTRFEPVVQLPATPGPCRAWIVLLKHGCSNQLFHNPQFRAFASEQRLAILQVLPETPLDAPGNTGSELTHLLLRFSRQLNHPELADAPVLLAGHSGAFNWCLAWAAHYPQRVLGVVGLRTGKLLWEGYDPLVYRQFPSLAIAGELDQTFRIEETLRLLQWATAECVPLTVLHQRQGSHAGGDVVEHCLPLMCDWIQRVVDRQLPSGADEPSQLVRIPYSAGLFGDLQAGTVGDLHAPSNRGRLLTWLPDTEFAEQWQLESVPCAVERIPADVVATLENQMLAVAPAAAAVDATAPHWPLWRGPTGDNHVRGGTPVTQWSANENILWKTPLAGLGHSSPIVVAGRVVITLVDDQQRFQLQAYQADSGTLDWERTLATGEYGEKHDHNSFATATVACDGERLYTAYVSAGQLWLDCTSVGGQPLWSQSVGPFVSSFGYGSSPTLYGSLVIVNGDQPVRGYLAALHRETGRRVWLTHRVGAASCGAPIVARTAGRDQLLLPGGGWTIAYDPLTGRPFWQCAGPANLVHATVVSDAEQIYVSGGHPEQKIMAIRSDSRGDVTTTHVTWEVKDGVTYIPSPVIADQRLILTNDGGVAIALDTLTGKVQWKKRLGGNFSASPVLVGDLLYVANRTGTTYVARIGEGCEVLAENSLPEEVLATPTVDGDRIYLRSTTSLYCIGSGATPTVAAETVQ